MREIKFRAWDNNIKKMIIQEKSDRLDKILHYWETHIKTSVMQYTGLKDKNDVEIYEGDIVRGNYLRGIGVVEWNDKFCKFDISHKMNIAPSDEFEVIGNIYENKDLLA
jgi:uncharacterized phage protein (TIGR01671 family)